MIKRLIVSYFNVVKKNINAARRNKIIFALSSIYFTWGISPSTVKGAKRIEIIRGVSIHKLQPNYIRI